MPWKKRRLWKQKLLKHQKIKDTNQAKWVSLWNAVPTSKSAKRADLSKTAQCSPLLMKLFSQTRLHVSINKIPLFAACISENKPVKQKILMLRETERTAGAAYLKSLPKLDTATCFHMLVRIQSLQLATQLQGVIQALSQPRLRASGWTWKHLPTTAVSLLLGGYFSTQMVKLSERSQRREVVALVFLHSLWV